MRYSWKSFIALYYFLAIRLPRFVMRQHVFLRLEVHHFDVAPGEVD